MRRLLDTVEIARPCPADWDAMHGDERVRYCDLCSLNVYNLAGMSRAEAEELLGRTEGDVCVRLFQRADGTVITRNCPVGLAALRRRVRRVTGAAGALLGGLLAFTGFRTYQIHLEREAAAQAQRQAEERHQAQLEAELLLHQLGSTKRMGRVATLRVP